MFPPGVSCFSLPAIASASPHRDQEPTAHLCRQHPAPRRVAGRLREKIQPESHECLHNASWRNCADTFSLFPIFPASSSAVGVFLLLHLPQPSKGGMLCNVRPRERKLSHGAGGLGPSPRFAGGGQGRAVSKPGSTGAMWLEKHPLNRGSGAAGCLPVADLVAMVGNKPAWSEREENV